MSFISVHDSNSFYQAIGSEGVDTVLLKNDVSLENDQHSLSVDHKLLIDLSGFTLCVGESIFSVDGGSLSLENGTFVSSGDTCFDVHGQGSSLTISNTLSVRCSGSIQISHKAKCSVSGSIYAEGNRPVFQVSGFGRSADNTSLDLGGALIQSNASPAISISGRSRVTINDTSMSCCSEDSSENSSAIEVRGNYSMLDVIGSKLEFLGCSAITCKNNSTATLKSTDITCDSSNPMIVDESSQLDYQSDTLITESDRPVDVVGDFDSNPSITVIYRDSGKLQQISEGTTMADEKIVETLKDEKTKVSEEPRAVSDERSAKVSTETSKADTNKSDTAKSSTDKTDTKKTTSSAKSSSTTSKKASASNTASAKTKLAESAEGKKSSKVTTTKKNEDQSIILSVPTHVFGDSGLKHKITTITGAVRISKKLDGAAQIKFVSPGIGRQETGFIAIDH